MPVNIDDLKQANTQQLVDSTKKSDHKFSRLTAWKPVALGQHYTLQVRDTVVTKNGTPLSNKEGLAALSTWCARQAQLSSFQSTVERNIYLLAQDITGPEFKPKTVLFADYKNSYQEIKSDANVRLQRLVCASLPVLPSNFSIDGDQYAVISAKKEAHNMNWILPDKDSPESKTTCEWSHVQNRAEVVHYYPEEIMEQAIDMFKFVAEPLLKLDPKTQCHSLILFGREYTRYAEKINSQGTKNVMKDIL